jgi:folate-binding protein YgfZ
MTPRRIIALSGTDTLTFLQGLVTNDVLPLKDRDGIVFAALLTPQGKYLVDFFVLRWQGQLMLDLPEPLADATLRRLSMYRLRADIKMTPSELCLSRGTGTPPPGAVADPRHPALGWRHYGPVAQQDGSDWDHLRVTHLIPETLTELVPDDSYILECGFERLHGVDFRKGCYVGQEVTARMKHKTELRKGLARVKLSEPVAMGTEIKAGDKAIGRVLTQSGGHAIAYLRLDQVTRQMSAERSTVVLVEGQA